MDDVGGTLCAFFAEPGDAGLPRDSGEWVGGDSITDTLDALYSLGDFCSDAVLEELASCFINDAWLPCADSWWLGVHEHQRLSWSWDSFENVVRSRRRYFFHEGDEGGPTNGNEELSPIELLASIKSIIEQHDLLSTLLAGTDLYRTRVIGEAEELKELAEIGAPPPQFAAAGRMNPAGIPYCYLSVDPGTAIAETVGRPPCKVAIGRIRPKLDMLIVDLTEIPAAPSLFNCEMRHEREQLLFLQEFIKRIATPIPKDGREHVDYVPSQVVSEYFSTTRFLDRKRVYGVKYTSTVKPQGENVVLFPPEGVLEEWHHLLGLSAIEHVVISTWEELQQSIRSGA